MKRTNMLWIALSLIFVGAFNIAVFLAVQTFTATFWASYGFIHFSYLMLVVSFSTIPKVKGSVVFGYPLIYISWTYFVVELIAGIIFMVFKDFNFTAAFIIQLIFASLYGMAYIPNRIANDISAAADAIRGEEILYIKNAASELNSLISQAEDTAFKKKLEKLYDEIRSSQVKSYPALAGIENHIIMQIEDLKERVLAGDYINADGIINDLLKLVFERNSKIAMLRQDINADGPEV